MMENTNWIHHPTEFVGELIMLIPLRENHFEEICNLAQEKSIWKYSVMDVNGSDRDKMMMSLKRKLLKRDSGDFYPFSIVLKSNQKIIGNTVYWGINKNNRSLEIGNTWLHPDYWGMKINTECKYLMLQFCFEKLKTIRVQIKAEQDNIRSRKAIEKVGFKFEGILRNDKILDDGNFRTAVYYSIIEGEWEEVKSNLKTLLSIT